MDLKEIVSSTRAYNFHSHTQFCDGRAEMAQFVEAAIKEGYLYYGFTPHSPIPFNSPCNMAESQVEEYFNEFNRLKELYSERINLYLSMEIDYLGDAWGASSEYFQNLPLDYRLSSVHFIPVQSGEMMVDIDGRPDSFIRKMHDFFNDDIQYVVDTFYCQTLRMIEAGGFDLLGHFDKIGFNASHFKPGIESEPWYQRHVDDIIEAVKGSDLVVEVNTKAWLPPVNATSEQTAIYSHRLFPSESNIGKLIRAGIPLAVNSDAHFTERISAGRDAAFRIIDSLKG
ncbi:MAG: histidinol-phosphatase [Duncaniella sp.]|nr:histidinol-phosphatase [Duncaniella sp.]MDE7146345.1 histidinol-phosphatase [Duncaniella sp.]